MINAFSSFQGYFENKVSDFNKEQNLSAGLNEGEFMKACIGSIRQKPGRNVFEGRIYRDKKQISVYGKSKEDVIKKLIAIRETKILTQQVKTFYAWFYEWFDTYKKPNIKEGSQRNILYCFERYIKPFFKDRALNMIEAVDVQNALNQIKAERMKQLTFNVYHGCLRQAYQLQLINKGVHEQLISVKHKTKTGDSFSREEQEILLPFLEQERFKIFKFYLLTGCRPAEALRVKWSDIDKENGLLHIPGTKTTESDRFIPLFNDLKVFLEQINKNGDYLFYANESSLRYKVRKLKKLTGIKSLNVYKFRHTFGTRAMESGIPMKVISKWLGHTNIKTTAQYYVHVLSDYEKTMADKFKISPDL